MRKTLQHQQLSRLFVSCWQVLPLAAAVLAVYISESAALANGQAASPSAPDAELVALLEIKRSIRSDPKDLLKNWEVTDNTIPNYCQWTGVSCTAGKLTSLQLMDGGLTGTISPYIGYLSNLTMLDLRNNSLSGMTPEQIGRCTELQYIYLDNNKLNGTMPTELGGPFQVKRISLANNLLLGELPHNLCSESMVELDLRNNRLSGQIPDGFMQNCPELVMLHLEENQLSGPIPNLVQVTENYTNEQFEGLYLQGNQLTGPIPVYLPHFSRLRELHLERNNLTGQIPPYINQLKRLFFSLNFSHNSLSGPIPKQVGTIECLVQLDLSHNNLSGEIPKELGAMPGLASIDLSFNSLSGQIPPFSQKNLTMIFDGNDMLCGFPLLKECSSEPSPPRPEGNGSRTVDLVGKWMAGVSAVLVPLVLVVGCVIRRQGDIRKMKVDVSKGGRGGPESSSRGQLFGPGPRHITVRELQRATDNFSPDRVIGTGSTTVVYRAVLENIGWKKAATEVAVKRLFVDEDVPRSLSRLIREVENMEGLQHRNLVRVLGYVLHSDVLALILEYMPNGNLEEALHGSVSNCTLSLDDRYKIAAGVARGLVYLHHDRDEAVAHLDLKPANILLDADLEPRIADFGGTRLVCPALRLDTHTMTCNFTVGYTAPEFIDYARPSTKADVYSFGIVLLELLTGVRPTASIFEESGTISAWMTDAILRKSALTLVDPLLRANKLTPDQENEILTMLHVAVNCTHRDPDRRPEMTLVLEILQKLRSSKQSTPASPSLDELIKEEAIKEEVIVFELPPSLPPEPTCDLVDQCRG